MRYLHGVHHSLRLLDTGQVACSRRGLTGWETTCTLRAEKAQKKNKHFKFFHIWVCTGTAKTWETRWPATKVNNQVETNNIWTCSADCQTICCHTGFNPSSWMRTTLSSSVGVWSWFNKSNFLYCSTKNAIPFIPTQITSPLPLVFFFPVCIHHIFNSQPGLLPAQCDLTWCDGSSQPGRGPGVVLTHPTPWLVPNSGSLSEGHRDLWDTQWHHSLQAGIKAQH